MRDRRIGMIAVIVLCCGIAVAQEKREAQEPGLASWLRSLRQKLDTVNPRTTIPVTTGVAGIRGARKHEDARLYWKGKRGDEQVSEAELAELTAAVALAQQGQTDAAVEELEQFMKQYPDSALIPDAKRTLDLVKAAHTEEVSPDVKANAQQQTGQTAPERTAPASEKPIAPGGGPKPQ